MFWYILLGYVMIGVIVVVQGYLKMIRKLSKLKLPVSNRVVIIAHIFLVFIWPLIVIGKIKNKIGSKRN